MDTYQDIPILPHVFRGGLAFNQRTIAGAVASLLGETTAGASTPLSLTELSGVLLLLESIATSSGMYLDGTLPGKDIMETEAALQRIGERAGVELDVTFITPPADTL